MTLTAPRAASSADLGHCRLDESAVLSTVERQREALARLGEPLFVVDRGRGPELTVGGQFGSNGVGSNGAGLNGGGAAVLGMVPALPLERLGDPSFCRDFGLRAAYVSGAMATGIASEAIVEEMARTRFLGFFGAAGLPPHRIEQAIDRIQKSVGSAAYGFNLIHSPNEGGLERAVTELYLKRGVRLVEASAFLDLTPNIVRFRLQGIHRNPQGEVVTPHRVVAKVSRVEVASKFMAPAPARILSVLVEQGHITPEQAQLAELVPVAQDVTAEADSGGHTDNRPLVSLLPTLIALKDRLQATHRFKQRLRVGAAGGISTPASAAAAFTMGAAYILTGSVQQACVESGTCDAVRQMLAEAEQADCTMCPAADMFEMGVKVQVLKRGTMFPMRATKLYELYRAHARIEDIPTAERASLEKNVFKIPLDDVWKQTVDYFQVRDPQQIARAEADPRHKMALLFRWYLGQSSRWANTGEPSRRVDYQVWCGPAMGAFNEWTKGTFLAEAKERRVVPVAWNLLHGAAVLLRQVMLRSQGFPVGEELSRIQPRRLEEIRALCGE